MIYLPGILVHDNHSEHNNENLMNIYWGIRLSLSIAYLHNKTQYPIIQLINIWIFQLIFWTPVLILPFIPGAPPFSKTTHGPIRNLFSIGANDTLRHQGHLCLAHYTFKALPRRHFLVRLLPLLGKLEVGIAVHRVDATSDDRVSQLTCSHRKRALYVDLCHGCHGIAMALL